MEKKYISLLALCLAFQLATFGQTTSNIQQPTSINSDAAAPAASAMLDVQATDRGILVPRMTSAQRTAIASPATGLLVFDTDTNGFWFYNGTIWTNLLSPMMLADTDNDTKIQVEKNTDEDVIRFDLDGAERMVLTKNTYGMPRLEFNHPSQSVAIGKGALYNNSHLSLYNTAVGDSALFTSSASGYNVAIGSMALYSNTNGNTNVATGTKSLYSNTSGYSNVATGYQSLYSNTSGNYNVALGMQTLFYNTTGIYNIGIGMQALLDNATGNFNLALGNSAMASNRAKGRNLAVGHGAMYRADDSTFGEDTYNTAIGNGALYGSSTPANNIGKYNTALGDAAMYSNSSGSHNTAAGRSALYSNTTGNYNTATGKDALYFNTSGHGNAAIASGTLYTNTTGASNTALGQNALYFNTTGNNNVAVGSSALNQNKAKSGSTAVGYQAMYNANNSETGGETYNTALGYSALYGNATPANNTGHSNTALGAQVLNSCSSGGYNTAVGRSALYSNTSGSENSAVGRSALYNVTNGTNNTAVGDGAGQNGNHNQSTFIGADINISTNRTNVSVLGYGVANAQCTNDNQVLLGNTGVGQIRAQVTSITAYSDARFKNNVQDNVPGLSFITRLKPVTYNEDPELLHRIWGTPDSVLAKIDHSDIKNQRFIGFIAQDVEQAAKASGFEFPGLDVPRNAKEVYSLRYVDFIMPMVKAIQEQQAEIATLKAENERLKSVETRLAKITAALQSTGITVEE